MKDEILLTSSFLKVSQMTHINKVVQGSQGAGKTFGILLRWVLLSQYDNTPQACTVTSSTYPSLRDGPIRDMHNILELTKVKYKFVQSPTYTFTINNWVIEFKAFDDPKKARGPRRDRLFINESDRMPWSIARHLIARSHVERIFDFNPVSAFWAHKQFVDVGQCDFVRLTYKDNEGLPKAEVDDIEKYAPWGATPDENYWRVFGEGKIGFVEGQILRYKTFKELPENCLYQTAYGVDWGDVDPMASVKVWVDHENMRLYWKQLYYASDANLEDEMFRKIKESDYRQEPVCCDHDPAAIRRARKFGLSARNANKKQLPGRIKTIKQYELFIHQDSDALLKEAGAWKYQLKKIGSSEVLIDYPDQSCEDHAIDAAAYGSMMVCR